MASMTEENRLCDILVGESEIHNRYSREEINIAPNQDLPVGCVLGRITATGNMTRINLTATNGAQKAAGIAADNYQTGPGGGKGVAIVRDAVVRKGTLGLPVEATAAQKATALAELKALGIIIRETA